MIKLKLPLIFLSILLLFLASCKKDDTTIPTTPPTTNPTDSTQTTPTIEAIDQKFFKELKQAGDVYSKNEVWDGYYFATKSMYLIFADESNKFQRGYIINPATTISGATKLEGAKTEGLNIYRYDKMMNEAKTVLEKGNQVFEFNFKIDGKDYYLQKYNEQDVNSLRHQSLSYATHEVFHVFQIEKWKQQHGIQDEKNFPLNQESISLQLLEIKIADKFPKETNKDQIRKYLEMFVAVRSKEIEIDKSSKKLVKNMANYQELSEGTARYVEYMTNKEIFSDFDPTFHNESSSNIQRKEEFRTAFAFAIWYGTGAALAYMIDQLSDNLEKDCIKEITLYDQAVKIVNLTDAQKESRLKEAKTEFKWEELQKEAKRLLELE
jgi:hypothetical protein